MLSDTLLFFAHPTPKKVRTAVNLVVAGWFWLKSGFSKRPSALRPVPELANHPLAVEVHAPSTTRCNAFRRANWAATHAARCSQAGRRLIRK